MVFSTTTDLNALHDEGLAYIKEQVLENPTDLKKLNNAQGYAMELYQIEVIRPEEYHPLDRFIKRLIKDPTQVNLDEYPDYSTMKSIRPRCVSEQEIATIRRVVPAEIKRDLTRCFRKEDLGFIHGLEGRLQALMHLGLIEEDEALLIYNSFNDKIASFK